MGLSQSHPKSQPKPWFGMHLHGLEDVDAFWDHMTITLYCPLLGPHKLCWSVPITPNQVLWLSQLHPKPWPEPWLECTPQPWDVNTFQDHMAIMWQLHNLAPLRCYVCNTPVILLTNFQLVLGHTVTSIRIPRFPELRFVLELGCKAPNTNRPDIIVMPSHFWVFQIMEDSYPQPYLLFSHVSPLVSVWLCIPVSPIHVTLHFLCFSLALPIPPT